MDNISDMMLGKVVRNFTISEDIFQQVGSYIDSLISIEDEEEFSEKLAEMFIKLSSLKLSVEVFINDLQTYFQTNAMTVESSEEQ